MVDTPFGHRTHQGDMDFCIAAIKGFYLIRLDGDKAVGVIWLDVVTAAGYAVSLHSVTSGESTPSVST